MAYNRVKNTIKVVGGISWAYFKFELPALVRAAHSIPHGLEHSLQFNSTMNPYNGILLWAYNKNRKDAIPGHPFLKIIPGNQDFIKYVLKIT